MALPVNSSYRNYPITEIDDGDSPYTITDSSPNDIFGDTAAGVITVVLPTLADNQGRRIYIKNIGVAGNDITVDGEGAETIDGNATQVVSDNECLVVQARTGGWSIM